jgi:hypothetical protein
MSGGGHGERPVERAIELPAVLPGEPIDAVLASLPRELQPVRDLWPDIESRLEPRRRHGAWTWQVAAALALVAVSSLITANLVRRADTHVARASAPVPQAQLTKAAFGPSYSLNDEYDTARRQLATELAQRLATLPPSARQKLEANLAEIHRAAAEINAALARQPGDPLLEELLLNTYQDELGVIASVNQLTGISVSAATARQENVKL